jgi:hypothetical protein
MIKSNAYPKQNDEMSSIEKCIHAQMECEYEERLSSDNLKV